MRVRFVTSYPGLSDLLVDPILCREFGEMIVEVAGADTKNRGLFECI